MCIYNAVQISSEKWGKKVGKSIGKIILGTGFIPNKSYHLFLGEDSQDDITVLEYGQYALIETAAKEILDSLKQFFPIGQVSQIFAYVSILCANNFVHVDQVQDYYEQSWLAQEYKQFSFHMGRTALGTLLDHLGRRTQKAANYEIAAVKKSSSVIVIDGHTIVCKNVSRRLQ